MLLILILVMLASFVAGYLSTTGVKSQWVRLGDVLVLGPLLIYVGFAKVEGLAWQVALVIFGATTVGYNLRNYVYELRDAGRVHPPEQ